MGLTRHVSNASAVTQERRAADFPAAGCGCSAAAFADSPSYHWASLADKDKHQPAAAARVHRLFATPDTGAGRDVAGGAGCPVSKAPKRVFPPNSRDPRRFFQGYSPCVAPLPLPFPYAAAAGGAQPMGDEGTPAGVRQLPEWERQPAAQPAAQEQPAAGSSSSAAAAAQGPATGEGAGQRWGWLSLGGKAAAELPAPAAPKARTITMREFIAMAQEQDTPPELPTIVPRSFRRNHERARAALKWVLLEKEQKKRQVEAEAGAKRPAEQPAQEEQQPPAKRPVSRDPRRRASLPQAQQ